VKITVIATGFRDQMPERRSRMLDVEAMPVVSVPVVAPNQWMKEGAPVAEPVPARGGLRFMSEVEEESHAPVVVAAAHAAPKAEIPVAQPAPAMTNEVASAKETSPLQEFGGRFSYEPETPSAPAAPRFAELSEPPTYAPLPRDYATEVGPRRTEETRPIGLSQFGQAQEPDHTDLDVPAFLRRGQF